MSRTDLPVSAGIGAVAPGIFPVWRVCGVPGRPWSWRPEGVLGSVAQAYLEPEESGLDSGTVTSNKNHHSLCQKF